MRHFRTMRVVGPLVAAFVAMVVMVVPAGATPLLFCNYVFNDSSHFSITLPTTSPETDCSGDSGATFAGHSAFNIRLVMTLACASVISHSDVVQLNANANYTSGNYRTTYQQGGGSAGTGAATYLRVAEVPCRASPGDDPHGDAGVTTEIADYLSTSLDKQAVSNYSYPLTDNTGVTFEQVSHASGVWKPSTPAAITSITLTMNLSAFEQNSRIAVYLD